MIHLLFVGDGPRDAVTVPRLVEGILSLTVKEETKNWKDLHLSGGKGLQRKLRYAVRQAKSLGLSGVVATVDTDNDREHGRLKELREARNEECLQSPFPMALAQADPHAEAWLLDDPVAIRRAFGMDSSAEIINVRRTKDPKSELEKLKRNSDRAGDHILQILADIAKHVEPSRCIHRKETGFDDFCEDARREIGPLASNCGDDCQWGEDTCGE